MQKIVLRGQADIPLDDKRCYFDIEIKEKCPECKGELNRDFSDNYWSYPTVNREEEIHLHCWECDQAYSVKGRITSVEVTLEYDSKSLNKDE